MPVLVVGRPRGSRKLDDTMLDNTRPKRDERLSESSGFNDETDTSCSGGYILNLPYQMIIFIFSFGRGESEPFS